VSSHLTRKELKQDKFAVEVEHTVDFFSLHRKETTKYGAALVIIALIGAGIYYYRNSVSAGRQRALGEAIALTSAPVTTTPSTTGATTFQTEAAKNDAIVKAFTKVAADYSGDDEGYIAEYFLAGQSVSGGKFDDARKKYQDVADHADANYASLAKLALAQVDFAENRGADAEKLLRDLIDHPTDMVSKTQATITLAKGIGPTKPDEARKLLTPLATQSAEVAGVVTAALGELPQK
jgi:predicted negative regulator of RcsB-dependent stress response